MSTDPFVGPEKEPMLLLDTSGSMNYATSATDSTPRRQTIREALGIVVERLAAEDSQAGHEEGGGGLRTVTFASIPHDLGDLNPSNLASKWQRIAWTGGTYIVGGIRELQRVYNQEFGSRAKEERPTLLALVITDGEAEDNETFENLMRSLSGEIYVEVAVIGYGSGHDQALAAYQRVAETNPHVRVTSLGSETDPEQIAAALLRMIA